MLSNWLFFIGMVLVGLALMTVYDYFFGGLAARRIIRRLEQEILIELLWLGEFDHAWNQLKRLGRKDFSPSEKLIYWVNYAWRNGIPSLEMAIIVPGKPLSCYFPLADGVPVDRPTHHVLSVKQTDMWYEQTVRTRRL